MKAEEFDKKFDEGESIIDHLDIANARRPEQEQKKSQCRFSAMDDSFSG